ncbi:MAG: nucleoside phosphorylase [Bacteroidia bacterium]
MNKIGDSELILNPDGSVYHLHLKPENVAENVIVVGDQGRVEMISKYFDKIEFKAQSREFVTHTGTFNGKRVTALSTGIGTDNIDIVMNELDAAVNIDLVNRVPKTTHTALNVVRIGTSGALQGDIPVDSFVLSTHGLGMDGLLNFYDVDSINDAALEQAFIAHTNWNKRFNHPYFVEGSQELINKLAPGKHLGITATACGFYGPQGRVLRLPLQMNDLNEKLTSFNYNGHRITNFEMETSALFGLGKLLGHNTATVCTIVANRIRKEFSKDYKTSVDALIQNVLQTLTA